ncbi:MAG: putative sugar nucleotidyl transferase [Gemmatimonadaceae bacterium]
MTRLYMYDDAIARNFEPFSVTRPVSELRAGAEVIRKRWERTTAGRARAFISSPALCDFEEFDAPHALEPATTIPAGSIVANSRCVISLSEVLATGDSIWTCEGKVCAIRLTADLAPDTLADGSRALDDMAHDASRRALVGRWVDAVWDFIGQLSPQLTEDIGALAPSVSVTTLMHDAIGSHALTVEDGALIEPYVIFDVTAGPVMVRRGASIAAFTRLIGPCYIGIDSVIVGDRIANCSIGDTCKVRGEISSSIVLGHSNKGHTGFVGHSYLGRWVNLGSGTTTSNLKNTYGTVQLWTPQGLRETGQQFLGTLFGDHAKTGIGTMLTTGTVLGAGANVFGTVMPPKYVPPFAWGEREPYAAFARAKFLDVAERVMSRRHVTLGERQRRHLARIHSARAPVTAQGAAG